MKEAKKIEKKTVGVLVGTIVILGAVIVALGYSIATKNSVDFLRNQQVGNLSFENAKLTYKDGVSTFTVEVYNESEEDFDVKTIDIKFKDKKGKTTTMTTKVDGLKSSEGRFLRAKATANVTNSVDLEYKINKD